MINFLCVIYQMKKMKKLKKEIFIDVFINDLMY